MSIKGKPDITQFIEGGAASEVKKVAAAQKQPKAVTPKTVEASPGVMPKRQKLVELPEPVFEALKDRAYEEYKKTGRRVTETEIIITALSQYLNV